MTTYSSISLENPKRLYLVVSLDYYSIEQVLINLTKELSMININFIKINLKTMQDIRDMKNIINTYPIIDSYRVVFIDNVDFKSKLYKELLKVNLPEHTKIVIPYYIQRRDNIKKDNNISSFEKIPYSEVVYQAIDKKRVIALANELGIKKLDKDIIDKLLSLDNMDVIKNDLVKLSSILDDDIDYKTMEQVISKSNEIDMFDLIEAISKKNMNLTMKVLREIRDKGENDIGITIRIRNKFRELYYIKSYLIKGLNKDDIAYKLKCHPYVALLGVNAVKNYTYEKLESAFITLNECEAKYKSGYKADLLESALIEILAIR